METLTALKAAESQERTRAGRYESLTNDLAATKARISKLQSDVPNTKALTQMLALCAEIPKDIVTRGGGGLIGVPGGLIARDFLQVTIGSALTDARNRDQQRKDRLATLQTRLAVIESELKEFA